MQTEIKGCYTSSIFLEMCCDNEAVLFLVEKVFFIHVRKSAGIPCFFMAIDHDVDQVTSKEFVRAVLGNTISLSATPLFKCFS